MGKKEERDGAIIESNEYKSMLKEIKQRIYKAQYEALKAVNKELITLYWDIGKMIIERQKTQGWGKSIVENLANDLQLEFPGMQGFSAANLWRMRSFFTLYRHDEKLAPLVREIGWTHNLVIMEKCKDNLQREFYIRKFMPEYVGKMQFYLAILDDKVCSKEENPSIGIIVCKSKNRTIVEYALKETNKPIGVATYKVTANPPKDMLKELPAPEQVARLMEEIN